MTNGPYDIGEDVELAALFTGPNPDFDPELAESSTNLRYIPTDPDVVTCTVQPPLAEVYEVEATSDPEVVGRWLATVQVDAAGIWWYRFEGEGDVVAIGEQWFRVGHRHVAPVGS